MTLIRQQLEAREREILAPQAAKVGRQRGRPGRARRRHPPGVPARSRSRHPLQGVPPAEAQDAGLLLADGRSLPHAADAHARGLADRPHDREGAAPSRGADRGHRARPRPRPHAVRPCRRARPRRAGSRRIQSLRAEPARGGRPRERRPRAEPHVGSPRRNRQAFEGQARRARSAPSRRSAHPRSKARLRASRISSPTSITTSTMPFAPGCSRSPTCPARSRAVLGPLVLRTHRPMVADVVHETLNVRSRRDFDGRGVLEATLALREFLFEALYENEIATGEFKKAHGHPRRPVGEGRRAARRSTSTRRRSRPTARTPPFAISSPA